MESVDNMLSNLMKSENYQKLDINSKKDEIEKVLYYCEDNGLIEKNSIFYRNSPKSFGFKYNCGISGGVTFEKISPDISSVNIENKDTVSLSDNNSSSLLSSKTSKRTNDLEEAILIYDLYSKEEKQEEYEFNQNIAKLWSNNGLKTDFYTNPTVDDYKTILKNKKIIFIQEHGIELAKGVFSTNKVYCFTIREQITKENKQKYHTDLKKKRVYSEILSNGTIQYCISPDFFTYYYDDNKLNSSIVILGNCMGFGNEQVVDYNFSFDLCEKCGANTVIGFHNSVNTSYSDYFNCNFVLQLLKNKSVKEAFNYVQSEFGYNDNEFLYKFTDLDQYCDKENKITWRELISNRTAATPILSGETTNKLNHRYIVSSIVKDSTTNNPIKDVRVEVIDNSGDSLEPIVTTTTDENGNFSLNLPYGSYSLSFNHDNYNYYGMSLDVDSEYVVLQNPVLLNPTTSENLIQNNDIVTLTGILKTEDYEINSSNKGTVTILDLDNPIKCYLKDGNNYDGKTEYNIKSVQISSPDLKEYIGQNVTVKGKVMLAHTAHHRRDVVLLESEVIKLNSIENYKEDFINALLENEDEWYVNWGASVGYQSELTFTDLNFDGKPEFIMQYGGGSMRNNNASAYYFSNNKLFEANTWFQNNLTAYYDKSNNSYVMLGNAYAKDGVNYWWCGDFELSFDGINIISDYYSSYIAEDLNYTGNFIYTYYNGANGYGDVNGLSKITETEYNKINEEKLKNLVNINMKREFILCSDWEKYSASEKRQALEKAYDSFTYDKY